MAPLPRREIARRFLPNQYLHWYCRGKLALDPLYAIVCNVLREDREPLLDVGCGVGLLLHCLRASGHTAPYIGIDSDEAKLAAGRVAAARGALSDALFVGHDLAVGMPEHAGSIALLDVLQYLEPDAQHRLLASAARRLSPGGVLVMRGGLDDGSWRAALTRSADRFGHAVRWMGTSFKAQPRPDELRTLLAASGLRAEFHPAWGRTPFNNWLICARRI